MFFDFKSAFETVTHSKLVKLLPSFAMGMSVVNWFAAFLRDRKFCVKVKDTFSNWTEVRSGCPQGTVAGPLMFIFYINALGDVLPKNVF